MITDEPEPTVLQSSQQSVAAEIDQPMNSEAQHPVIPQSSSQLSVAAEVHDKINTTSCGSNVDNKQNDKDPDAALWICLKCGKLQESYGS